MFHKKVIRKDSILNQYNLGILVTLYSPLNILNENVDQFYKKIECTSVSEYASIKILS